MEKACTTVGPQAARRKRRASGLRPLRRLRRRACGPTPGLCRDPPKEKHSPEEAGKC